MTRRAHPRRREAVLALAVAVLATALAFGLGETVLAAAGYKPGWKYARGWGADDMDCRYKPNAGVYPNLFGCATRFNSYGARGPEPVKPVVLSLGDSCTFGVELPEEKTYAGLLSVGGIETVNAGVPGYNSYTGLRRLEGSSLLALHPKLVTIYFGWNDHWRAVATESAFARLRWLAQYSRLASRLMFLESSIWSGERRWRRYRWFPQVPLGSFRENLRQMVAISRRAGAKVVLITPPADPRRAAENEGWFESRSLDELRDHAKYAQAVREVAAETGAGLVDLEREIEKRAGPNRGEYFLDFVHLSAKGHRLLADLLIPWAK